MKTNVALQVSRTKKRRVMKSHALCDDVWCIILQFVDVHTLIDSLSFVSKTMNTIVNETKKIPNTKKTIQDIVEYTKRCFFAMQVHTIDCGYRTYYKPKFDTATIRPYDAKYFTRPTAMEYRAELFKKFVTKLGMAPSLNHIISTDSGFMDRYNENFMNHDLDYFKWSLLLIGTDHESSRLYRVDCELHQLMYNERTKNVRKAKKKEDIYDRLLGFVVEARNAVSEKHRYKHVITLEEWREYASDMTRIKFYPDI